MKEYGILFTPDNIRLIISGKKSMTRRVIEKIDKYKNLKKGDRLYIQECYRTLPCTGDFEIPKIIYRLDSSSSEALQYLWKSSMFMPKSAARYWLEAIRDTWVENIQDISEGDAKKEGSIPLQMDMQSYLPSFQGMWDVINRKRGYAMINNPKVRVIEFKLLEGKCIK